MFRFTYLMLFCWLTACATAPLETGKPMPERGDKSSVAQLAKNDLDRMADVELEENSKSLRLLMTKLYKRNPKELAKSTPETPQKMTDWVFDGAQQHHYLFAEIDKKQGTDAIHLAFEPQFNGDRVLAFIVGMHTMLLKAHGNKTEFYLTDEIHPQNLYNVARNVEIAAWKLATNRHTNGELMLLSNELSETERNLSFEREIGKLIGRIDLYAFTLAEKSQRLISRIVQSVATMAFLPF